MCSSCSCDISVKFSFRLLLLILSFEKTVCFLLSTIINVTVSCTSGVIYSFCTHEGPRDDRFVIGPCSWGCTVQNLWVWRTVDCVWKRSCMQTTVCLFVEHIIILAWLLVIKPWVKVAQGVITHNMVNLCLSDLLLSLPPLCNLLVIVLSYYVSVTLTSSLCSSLYHRLVYLSLCFPLISLYLSSIAIIRLNV